MAVADGDTGSETTSYYDVDDDLDDEFVDVEEVTSVKRDESAQRLRTKQQQLRRFHDQICRRIGERQQQHRREVQQQEQLLDAKFAAVLEATRPTAKPQAPSPVRARGYEALAKHKSAQLKGCALATQVEKVLQLDAQVRNIMLASVRLPTCKSHSDDANAVASATLPHDWCCESDDDDDSASPTRSSAHALLPKQRVALYATVRKRYMERGRADAQRRTTQPQPAAASPVSAKQRNRPVAASKHSASTARHKPANSKTTQRAALAGARAKDRNDQIEAKLLSRTGVKVIDITAGCDVRLLKHVTVSSASSTPWRAKHSSARSALASPSPSVTADASRSRFLRALANELETPSLCACARNMATTPHYERPCANNCALYNAPAKRDKLLASVCKQQQQQQQQQSQSPAAY